MNLNWCPLLCYVGGQNERTEKETYPVYPRIHCVVCSAFSVDLSKSLIKHKIDMMLCHFIGVVGTFHDKSHFL